MLVVAETELANVSAVLQHQPSYRMRYLASLLCMLSDAMDFGGMGAFVRQQ